MSSEAGGAEAGEGEEAGRPGGGVEAQAGGTVGCKAGGSERSKVPASVASSRQTGEGKCLIDNGSMKGSVGANRKAGWSGHAVVCRQASSDECEGVETLGRG